MRAIALTAVFLSVTCCGFNGNQRLTTNSSKQEIGGKASLSIDMGFIAEIKQICTDLNPLQDFVDEVAQKKEIAKCTIDNLDVLSISLGSIDADNSNCDEGADLSAYTPEQQADILAACAILNGF